jgi:hypothetical protein
MNRLPAQRHRRGFALVPWHHFDASCGGLYRILHAIAIEMPGGVAEYHGNLTNSDERP